MKTVFEYQLVNHN